MRSLEAHLSNPLISVVVREYLRNHRREVDELLSYEEVLAFLRRSGREDLARLFEGEGREWLKALLEEGRRTLNRLIG